MTRIPLTLFGLFVFAAAARADVPGPFDPFLHRVRIQHVAVLAEEIPGYSYMLWHPAGRRSEWLELPPGQRVEVPAWSDRRGRATVLYAIPQAVIERAGSKGALAAKLETERNFGDGPSIGLAGVGKVGPADTRSAVVETITIRRDADGVPTFDVESKTVARAWLCPLVGLGLSALAVWQGWRWFGRNRSPQSP